MKGNASCLKDDTRKMVWIAQFGGRKNIVKRSSIKGILW